MGEPGSLPDSGLEKMGMEESARKKKGLERGESTEAMGISTVVLLRSKPHQ